MARESYLVRLGLLVERPQQSAEAPTVEQPVFAAEPAEQLARPELSVVEQLAALLPAVRVIDAGTPHYDALVVERGEPHLRPFELEAPAPCMFPGGVPFFSDLELPEAPELESVPAVVGNTDVRRSRRGLPAELRAVPFAVDQPELAAPEPSPGSEVAR